MRTDFEKLVIAKKYIKILKKENGQLKSALDEVEDAKALLEDYGKVSKIKRTNDHLKKHIQSLEKKLDELRERMRKYNVK